MTHTRRELIQRGAAVGAGIFAAGNLGALFTGSTALAGPAAPRASFGPLLPDPAGLLDLPKGFAYRVVSAVGQPLGTGVVPDRFDGTATFAQGRGLVMVRNHEQGTSADFPAVAAAELTYDPAVKGGTTTLELDPSGRKVAEYVSLAGTDTNCAGGLTPWGTWLTCEETEGRAGQSGRTKDHGFVFEVDPKRPERNVTPTPLPALGRYAHEAAAIDPRSGEVFLTEDASSPNGIVYRCRPNQPLGGYGSLRAGGVLDAMRCTDGGTFVPDLSAYSVIGTELAIGWVAVPDPLALAVPTRLQLPEVTRSRKLEGAWWGNNGAYIVCSYARTTDGSVGQHDGQVWKLDPKRNRLKLEANFGLNPDSASDLPDGPDNITVSPFGGLLIATDGEGAQHLFTIGNKGQATAFARNARDDGEFTGVVFSPDNATLFANLQQPGITFAITGPFKKLA